MDFIDTIVQLTNLGIGVAVMAAVIVAFMTDNLTSGKTRDREVNRESQIGDRYAEQVDELIEAMKLQSDAWEKRNAIDEAREQFRERSQKS